ncbi:MAG TPA: SHOCT domain-containing protein [Acidimicrobiia bacterium]|nr:SHOCT domain-containing protein [Acidimicrobiia bacterium]
MWMDWNAMGLFGWTMMILFWTAVTVAIIWAIRSLTAKPSPTLPTPLEVLERRFAAGEIDREDFEERKRLLIRS